MMLQTPISTVATAIVNEHRTLHLRAVIERRLTLGSPRIRVLGVAYGSVHELIGRDGGYSYGAAFGRATGKIASGGTTSITNIHRVVAPGAIASESVACRLAISPTSYPLRMGNFFWAAG